MMTLSFHEAIEMFRHSGYSSGRPGGTAIGVAEVTSGLLLFVVVNRLPESDPDVEPSQTAANAADKAAGYKGPQPGISQQQMVIRPLGPPGQNY
jgi:hypothetical protein